MKLALLGNGKTGSKVAELFDGDITVFDLENPATKEKLDGHDVVISFLPGPAFLELIPLLVEAQIPVVSGSTGITLPSELNHQLETQKTAWIVSHNFSLGMNIVREMIYKLAKINDLFDDAKFTIHEVHHTKKLDAPSGTAISWKDWLGLECDITYGREGDVVGYHRIDFESQTEKISLVHEALDRGIFAKGALWAANIIHTKNLSPRVHHFNDVVFEQLWGKQER